VKKETAMIHVLFSLLLILAVGVTATVNSVTLISPDDSYKSAGSMNEFVFNAASDANEAIECDLVVDGKIRDSLTAANGAKESLSIGLADGTYNWYVSCTDEGGTLQSSIRTITVGTAAEKTSVMNSSTASKYNTTKRYLQKSRLSNWIRLLTGRAVADSDDSQTTDWTVAIFIVLILGLSITYFFMKKKDA